MMQPLINTGSTSPNKDSVISPSASQDPYYPTYLYDDSALSEYYSSSGYYYYDAYWYSSDYQLIWLHTTNTASFTVYSDSSYSTTVGYSTSDYGVDWYVYRPSYSQDYYPKVYMSYSGYSGYIESESGYDMSTGSSYSFYLGSSEYGEIYEVYLSSSDNYVVTLDVPSTGDFDLYVFYSYSGDDYQYDYHSSTSGTGTDEEITLTPPSYTGYYAIVILEASGYGTAYLEVRTVAGVPGFEISFIIMALAASILLGLVFFNKSKKFLF
jgi:hypothetical protein